MPARSSSRPATIVFSLLIAVPAAAADSAPAPRYQALLLPLPSATSTWAILPRDGANRQVEPYLSSLGGGEAGTGAIVSPEFTVTVPAIAFTIRGHDGPGGGRNQNFIALVEAASGQTLAKTPAPGSDELQPRSWDASQWQGRKVRIEVHDGNAEGAFAWLGIGSLDAGPALSVDFRQGLPDGWKMTSQPVVSRSDTIVGGVPFRRETTAHTLVPSAGALELPCGFTAQRLFFLGCTVARGTPLEQYGSIELVYASGASQAFPLIYGYTLDGEGKRLSPSRALHLHPSADPFQHYLVIQPRAERLASIRLSRNPLFETIPRLTAITCETADATETLTELAAGRPSAAEETWIREHAISDKSPEWKAIAAQVRRDHRLE